MQDMQMHRKNMPIYVSRYVYNMKYSDLRDLAESSPQMKNDKPEVGFSDIIPLHDKTLTSQKFALHLSQGFEN